MDACYLHAIRDTVTVRVEQGNLVGAIREGAFGATYKAFLGIPYAASPVGSLRFKDPQPPECWKGKRIVTDDMCIKSAQVHNNSTRSVLGSEDCLYLNVYVPYEQYSQASCKAVMVWIHGGNFYEGSGDFSEIRPDYLIKKDVILVTVNYRLGILGFLNIGHDEANGNQGLKDQIAALKWIKKNIFSFGGDSNNITIFGNGAGAISAHLLMLSPLSKGLFKKAILQSGVALCNWAVKEYQQEGFKLASQMGCTSVEPKAIVEFFRTIPYRVLTLAAFNLLSEKERDVTRVIFGPTIDTLSSNPFLPRPIKELLNNGDNIPIIIGHNTHETLEFNTLEKEELSVENLQPYVEVFAGPQHLYKVPVYTKQILNLYKFGPPFCANFNKICLDELYYNLAIRTVVLNRAKEQKPNTYYYIFSYKGSENKTSSSIEPFEVAHGDELLYLFYLPNYRNTEFYTMTRDDYNIINMITEMWSNFAKTGNPNFVLKDAFSQWDPVDSEKNLTCFEINKKPSGWLEKQHVIFSNVWY